MQVCFVSVVLIPNGLMSLKEDQIVSNERRKSRCSRNRAVGVFVRRLLLTTLMALEKDDSLVLTNWRDVIDKIVS